MPNDRIFFAYLKPVLFLGLCIASALTAPGVNAQEESINPGINDTFQDPDVQKFIARFERDGRAVYDKRQDVIDILDLEPGMDVADIGAGTGFFSLMIAEEVGPKGTVYALDIAKNFTDYVAKKAKEKGLKNVKTIVNDIKSTNLKKNSIDRAIIVDTYHHFEYPFEMLASIRKALRPGGIVVLVDFERIENVSREFVLNMVRGGKGHFTDEFKDAGFDLIEEVPFTEEHYILQFRERD